MSDHLSGDMLAPIWPNLVCPVTWNAKSEKFQTVLDIHSWDSFLIVKDFKSGASI